MKIQVGSNALVDPTEKRGRAPGQRRPDSVSRPGGARSNGPVRISGGVQAAERKTTATLTVRTADGDTVSLSFESQRRVEQSGVRTAGAAARTAREESTVSVSVTTQGDLDAGEIKDIERLVNRLAAGIRDVEQGRPEKAAARFERIQAGGPKLDSLAAYAVAIQSEEAVQSARFSALA